LYKREQKMEKESDRVESIRKPSEGITTNHPGEDAEEDGVRSRFILEREKVKLELFVTRDVPVGGDGGEGSP